MTAATNQVKPAGKKPPAAGKGRVKGSQNKFTREVKEMILEALADAGGVNYLVDRAKDPRTASAFLGLVGKVLPMQVVGDPDNPLQHSITVSFK